MKAVIGSVHRAGSNYLASVLNQAIKGYKVEGENMYLSKHDAGLSYQEHAQRFIDIAPDNFIHISPQFTYLAKELNIDKVAFLIRDPYQHALSKINFYEGWRNKLLDSLIDDIELFYGYIAEGRNKVFKYEGLDEKGIEAICKWLDVDFDLSGIEIDIKESEVGNFKSLDVAIQDKEKLKKLMTVIKKYQKKFKY